VKLFHFKQFSLCDSQCAMKIGTDGVLLGSVAACYPGNKVLDIGTGSGLIALMIAQKNNSAEITAIEIDQKAALQAMENFKNSPWPDRIEVINIPLQHYCKESPARYDLIVCNPPFFHASLKPGCNKREIARHSTELPPEELITNARSLLSPQGILLLIIPFEQLGIYTDLGRQNALNVSRVINIYPNKTKPPKRAIVELSLMQHCICESLVIETEDRHQFSAEYISLTKDYYPGIK
jgi:tRNA1Val (adenine37-N6)-methyltransferase